LPWVERRLIDRERRIVGTPDLVEQRINEVWIVDIKSGVGPLELTPTRRLQLLIYAHLVAVNGIRQPRWGELVSPSGKNLQVELPPTDVAAAVERLCRLREEYNTLVGREATVAEVASPSPDACRGCLYRVICPAFAELWQQDWQVSRGVFGTLESVSQRDSHWEVEVLARSPQDLDGKRIRVTDLPGPPAVAVGALFNVIGTDVMGDPTLQRARWSTAYWPPLQQPSESQ
jgi:hypothetical protein